MPQATLAKLTYEEFLEQTPEDAHREWVDGEAVPMSPISQQHQEVSGFVLSLLRYYVEDKHLGLVFYEPFQMKLVAGMPGRAPDVMFVANESVPRIKKTHIAGPADMVIEVVSQESRARDRGDKFYEYEAGGVREYWLIDPARRQAEFYILDNDGVYHPAAVGRDGVYYSAVLPGLWIRPEWLWQSPPPPLSHLLREWKLI